jgi:hypothetical protein
LKGKRLRMTREDTRLNGWFDLRRGAAYACLSVRTLRRYIGDPVHPLPVRLVGGKWLVRQHDLDAWLQGFPGPGEEIDRVVDEVMAELRHGNSTCR